MNIGAVLRHIRFHESLRIPSGQTRGSAPCARMLLRRVKSIAHGVRSCQALQGMRAHGALLPEVR